MKKTVLAFLILSLGMFAATTATAQISSDVTFNLPMPSGDFADAYKPGFGAGADVFVGLPMVPIKLGGHVAYNRFSADDDFDDGSSTIIEILPSARYTVGLPMSPVGFFGQLGLGMYNWSNEVEAGGVTMEDDGTDFGFAVGIGVTAKFLPTMGFIVMPMYHTIMTEDENTNYISVNLGLTF